MYFPTKDLRCFWSRIFRLSCQKNCLESGADRSYSAEYFMKVYIKWKNNRKRIPYPPGGAGGHALLKAGCTTGGMWMWRPAARPWRSGWQTLTHTTEVHTFLFIPQGCQYTIMCLHVYWHVQTHNLTDTGGWESYTGGELVLKGTFTLHLDFKALAVQLKSG